jgi:hypothetical protein
MFPAFWFLRFCVDLKLHVENSALFIVFVPYITV